jgi:hypothetical protein
MDDPTRTALIDALLDKEILYHYCSASTFQQIVSNGTIRLSALTLSNDSLEGKLVSAVIKKLAAADGLEQWKIDQLMKRVDLLEELFDGLGLCLSEDGDLLSQWRGYADDAYGFSIGFSRSYLEWLGKPQSDGGDFGFGINKVLYSDEDHERELRPSYEEMMKQVSAGALQMNRLAALLIGKPKTEEEAAAEKKAFVQLSHVILTLFTKWFLLKSNAFREEQEVRLISYLFHRVEGARSVGYRATRNSIVPYREFALTEKERKPIARVVLGPRQVTPVRDVQHFLKVSGFGDVEVVRSTASYR